MYLEIVHHWLSLCGPWMMMLIKNKGSSTRCWILLIILQPLTLLFPSVDFSMSISALPSSSPLCFPSSYSFYCSHPFSYTVLLHSSLSIYSSSVATKCRTVYGGRDGGGQCNAMAASVITQNLAAKCFILSNTFPSPFISQIINAK